MRVRFVCATFALATLCLGACGPPPPQAPRLQAQKLDEALGGISSACGEAYQVTAFPGDHRADLATLEATAASKAQELLSVYRHNPVWIYQGETVHDLVGDAAQTLRSCGLVQAAAVLEGAGSAPR